MSWEWESFGDLLQFGVKVVDAGPLPTPVTSFALRRDRDRELVLETVTPGKAWGAVEKGVPGGVYQPNGVVRFASDFGLAGEATGVSPGSSSSKVGPDGQRQLRQTARVGRVEVRVVRAHKVGLILDWVENLDGESMLWAGGGITDEAGHAPTRRIGGGLAAITLRGLNRGSSSRPAALELNVGGVNLFVCSAEPRDGSVRPGYFLYHGAPDEETRRRIREAVGFAMGCGLVYLGSTALTAKSELAWTSALSGNPFGDRIFDFFAQPPAPLDPNRDHWVEEGALSRCADAIFRHYDQMNFRQLSWNYWHGVCAPAHMKPAHFGAAIEGLQDAYNESHPNKVRKRIIADGSKAKVLTSKLIAALSSVALEPEVAAMLKGKISNLNQASGALVSDRVFRELGLARGTEEVAAWQRRNAAAHGKARQPEDTIPLIQETKILRLLLNRMVLRISGASSRYLDNYTLGHAVRALEHPVGGAPLAPDADKS